MLTTVSAHLPGCDFLSEQMQTRVEGLKGMLYDCNICTSYLTGLITLSPIDFSEYRTSTIFCIKSWKQLGDKNVVKNLDRIMKNYLLSKIYLKLK